jgi:hypothetical protein
MNAILASWHEFESSALAFATHHEQSRPLLNSMECATMTEMCSGTVFTKIIKFH